MTKARTKSQAREARRGRPRKDGPREQSGRPARSAAAREREAATMAVVEARCRAVGVWPEPIKQAVGEPDEAFAARRNAREAMIRAAMQFVGLPWMGDECGRAIRGAPDVSELWQAICLIRGRRTAYLWAIDAPRLKGADAAAIGRVQEENGAVVQDRRTDDRTEEERAEDAEAAWERIQVDAELIDVVLNDMPFPGFPLATRLRKFIEAIGGGPMIGGVEPGVLAPVAVGEP